MVMWPKTILPSAGGRAGGGEGAAVALGSGDGSGAWLLLGEAHAFQAGRRGLEGGVERLDLRPELSATMSTRSIGRPSKRGPGRGGAVGDALHLFEVFRVVAAQEQGVDQGATSLSRLRRAPSGSDWSAEQRT